ncbi:MAG: fibronectin type III domain-containing protein [Acidobacteria bacterium]|nr:fibronectin type III domain-containing protein [Acidobacteriota bacterium]
MDPLKHAEVSGILTPNFGKFLSSGGAQVQLALGRSVRRSVSLLMVVAVVVASMSVGVSPAAAAAVGASVPAAPTSLVAYRGNASAEIGFTAGANGGAAITNYKYQINDGSWTAFSPAVTTPSVTIGGLTNGTTYSVKLRAVNSAGDGAVSDAVVVTPAVVDAVTWTARTAAEANSWKSVAYGNGVFVAVADSGTNRVMTSPDGVTWTARTASEANNWSSVAYGNGVFVAVAGNGTNRVMTSSDGVTWTARTAAAANAWKSVAYGNGVFVAVADNGTNRVMTSSDGATWTARTASEANSWNSVAYGNGVFVAVASSGTNRVMTSSDGVTWTAQTAAAASPWGSVAYGNGVFVAVAGDAASRMMTSPDGVTWTARTSSFSQCECQHSVTYGNGVFVAVASSGTNRVMTSPDGVTWTARSAAAANAWRSVTYGNGVFVAVANSGTDRVMTSSLVELATAPDAPTSLVATPGDGSVSVAFNAGADGGASISNYEYQLNGVGSWVALSPTDGTSPVVISGLTNGTAYTVKLRAVNSVGSGAESVASDSFTPSTVPSAPTDLEATPGDGSASISFTAGSDGGGAITTYQYSLDEGFSWNDADGTTSPLTISGLTNYTGYGIKLRAVNSAGNGAPSSSVSTMPATVAPVQSAPTVGSTRRSILASWSLVTPASGARVKLYRPRVYLAGTNTKVRSCKGDSTETSCEIKGLTLETAYEVRVHVLQVIGTGPSKVVRMSLVSAPQAITLH